MKKQTEHCDVCGQQVSVTYKDDDNMYTHAIRMNGTSNAEADFEAFEATTKANGSEEEFSIMATVFCSLDCLKSEFDRILHELRNFTVSDLIVYQEKSNDKG